MKDSSVTNLFKIKGRLRPWVVPLVLILTISFFTVNGIKELTSAFQYQRATLDQSTEALGIATEQKAPSGITTVALFGVDSREGGFCGLSDSIMIITVDRLHNSVKLVSVLRDSLVRVEDHGYQKINAAYSIGGAQLAVKTLNQTFGLAIRDYATVDFNSMAALVDAVGGVEVELTASEWESANGSIVSLCEEMGQTPQLIEGSGLQTLNGMQAVGYSRIRNVATPSGANNDFGRTERQRNVMTQLFQRALNMSVTRYPGLIRALLPYVETTLGYSEILDLAGILGQEGLTFTQCRMPADRIIIDANFIHRNLGSCVYYDLEYAAGMMQGLIYEDIPFEEYMQQHTVTYHRWYGT